MMFTWGLMEVCLTDRDCDTLSSCRSLKYISSQRNDGWVPFLVIRNYFASNGFNSPDLIILFCYNDDLVLQHCSPPPRDVGLCMRSALWWLDCSEYIILSRNTNKQLSGSQGWWGIKYNAWPACYPIESMRHPKSHPVLGASQMSEANEVFRSRDSIMRSLNYPKYSWFCNVKSAALGVVQRSHYYPCSWV